MQLEETSAAIASWEFGDQSSIFANQPGQPTKMRSEGLMGPLQPDDTLQMG